jgi:hypothetical protein
MTETMIPFTEDILRQMMTRVLDELLAHGLLEFEQYEDGHEKIGDQFIELLRAQGLVDEHNGIPMGRCLLLPSQDRDLSLLLVTPCPVDPYDENLRRKPSPVRFDRNACGEIILPGQWLLAKVEELANNPALGEEPRRAALRFSRVAMVEDLILPAEMQTLALSVPNPDGTTTVLEALPGGYIVNMNVAG